MGLTKLRLPVVLALIGMAAFINFLQVKANEETDDAVSPAAVWTPDDDDLADIVQACDGAVDYGRCFVDQMGSLAPSAWLPSSISCRLKQTKRRTTQKIDEGS